MGWYLDSIELHAIKNGISSAVDAVFNILKSSFGKIAKGISAPFEFAWGGIKKLYSGVGNVISSGLDFAGGVGDKIVDGLASVKTKVKDTVTAPFNWAKDKILSFFGGNSPSELGLRIVDGLASVGGMLLDNIKKPFELGAKIVGKVIDSLFGGSPKPPTVDELASSLENMSVTLKIEDYLNNLMENFKTSTLLLKV